MELRDVSFGYEPGFPVLLVGAGGSVSADVDAIAARLSDYSCAVAGLFDAASAPLDAESSVRINSGLPEELTPMGFDPEDFSTPDAVIKAEN